jgi:thioesterase domain-containing protein/acyl carrier protein
MPIGQLDEGALQQWIVERVARELAVSTSSIDPHSGLMSLGIDSLALIGLAGELAELLNCEIQAELMWELGSIRDISRHFGGRAKSHTVAPPRQATTNNSYLASAKAWSPIRALQPNGNSPPLFLVHGIGGGTTNYRRLTSHLGDNQPVFGLDQSPDPPSTIEEMARMLLDGLQTVQRKGPYRLFGFCFGAVVAYELAQQLLGEGHEVRFLGMVDPPSPGRFPRLKVHDAMLWPGVVAAAIAASLPYRAWTTVKDPKSIIRRNRARVARWGHRLSKRLGMTDQPVSDYWISSFSSASQVTVRHNTRALFAYAPQRYPGRLTLLVSKEHRREAFPVAWRWRRSALRGAALTRLPLLHTEMLDERSAHFVAQQLK